MTKFHAKFPNLCRIWSWSTESCGCGLKTKGIRGCKISLVRRQTHLSPSIDIPWVYVWLSLCCKDVCIWYMQQVLALWCQVGIPFSKQYTTVIYHCTLRM